MSERTDFLAADLGASGGRVLLASWDGNAFGLQELHRFPNGPINVLGSIHWDVLRLWSELKLGIARYAAAQHGQLAGIGLDTWGVDYALLDRAGRLLGNPFHYRDARTNGMMENAFAVIPRSEIYTATGLQFMQINTLFQLYSQSLAKDPQLDAAATLLMMPDLLNYWLSGERVVEYTIASTSQMLLARERTWANDLLDRLGIPTHILGRIVPPGTVLGTLLQEVRDETGLQDPAPVLAVASHDTASAVAAVPDLGPDDAYISSGTWSLVGMEVPQPILGEQALASNFTNEGGVNNTIRLLKNITGLWLVQECRRQWQREGSDYTWDDLVNQAARAEAFRSFVDPDAADFLAPGNMPAALRAYCRRTGQADLESVGSVVRCTLESVALKSRYVMEALEKLVGRQIRTLRIVGGGTQNKLLCQFIADACGRPVVAGPIEATALGNVVLQAIATGHLSSLSDGRRAIANSFPRQTYEPRDAAAWQDAYDRFLQLIVQAH
jgi:rhamnulokinase